MSKIKAELQAVLIHELPNLRNELFGESLLEETKVKENKLMYQISTNDNLLQELENVVHSFAKPVMEVESKIRRLEATVTNEQSAKQDILDMYNIEQERNKNLHERNKRLSKANSDMQKGHFLKVNKVERCDHLIVEFSPSEGLAFETAFKMRKVQVFGESVNVAYHLECTKCGKIPK